VFTFGSNDNLLSLVMIVSFAFVLFPLSLVSIWWPRAAAIGIATNTAVFALCLAIATIIQARHEPSLEFNWVPSFSLGLPSLLISATLFLSSKVKRGE
jgi:hypothetical protein